MVAIAVVNPNSPDNDRALDLMRRAIGVACRRFSQPPLFCLLQVDLILQIIDTYLEYEAETRL